MVTKVTKKINLSDIDGYSDLTTEQKEGVKKEVGEYVVEAILSDVGQAKSPVNGRSFRGLSEKYKNFKKKISSSSTANMELFGDMLDSLEYETYRDGIEVGIFDEVQAQKADNHNKFSSKSLKTKVPKRQFIPKGKESFKKTIESEIVKIIREASGEA